jgi:hypothetical protein
MIQFLHELSTKLDDLIQFERGDYFFNKLHPGVIHSHFPGINFRPTPAGLQAPVRGSELAKKAAKLLDSSRGSRRIKPSDTYEQYLLWKRATGNIPMRRAA